MSRGRPRVVVLGAGFAGLTATNALRKRLSGFAEIELVDRHNYHLFTPLLFQVATCSVDPYAVAYPIHQFSGRDGVAFRRATVTRVDPDRRVVYLNDGELSYDQLVLALGSTTNYFGNHSAMEHALPLKTLEDGIAIRNHILDVLERAAVTDDANERRELLTFVTVGGGATGVETAAALADLLHRVVPTDYPRLREDRSRVVLIEAKGKLVGQMSERLATVAQRKLREMGVEVWLNAKAEGVSPRSVSTADGRSLATRTVIWATGVRCPDIVSQLDLPHGTGGSVVVDDYLRVPGHPEIYAVGDNAHYTDPRSRGAVPALAAAAVQEANAVAENITRHLAGLRPKPFHYHSLGTAVSFGHVAGVLEADGLVFDGLAGLLAWRLIHLWRITGMRNKLATALDWSIGYLHDKDTARLDLAPTDAVGGRLE